VHTPNGLRAAVATQDLTALTRVPGIGRKGAQRIVLELTDRLGAPAGAPTDAAGAAPPSGGPTWREQVVEALVGLGWSARQAGDAVEVVAADGASGDAASGNVAAVLRAALQHLGRAG
jgi:Holliday junction DNA helicase RuvA